MKHFVPITKRKAHHAKEVRQTKAGYIPRGNRASQLRFTLPEDWITAFQAMYPDLPVPAAIKRYILASVKPIKSIEQRRCRNCGAPLEESL